MGVVTGRFSGIQKIFASVGGNRPVVVLAGAVNAGERFFVQQTHQTVLCSHVFHDLHGQLIVIGGGVGIAENGGQFVLGGGDFVVFGLGQNTQFPQLFVQIFHVIGNTGLQGAKIVVVHFLPLRGLCAEQGAAGHDQIFALIIHFFVDQEIFLLRADSGDHFFCGGIAKQAEYAQCLFAQLIHGA